MWENDAKLISFYIYEHIRYAAFPSQAKEGSEIKGWWRTAGTSGKEEQRTAQAGDREDREDWEDQEVHRELRLWHVWQSFKNEIKYLVMVIRSVTTLWHTHSDFKCSWKWNEREETELLLLYKYHYTFTFIYIHRYMDK